MHETTQANENQRHVESIRNDLVAIYEGRVWRLADGEEITLEQGEELTEEQEQDAEEVTFWDFFEDVLDVTYYVRGHASNPEVLGARFLVAFGGPNIYVDTYRQSIELYWWTDRAECELWHEVAEAIDDAAAEWFNC